MAISYELPDHSVGYNPLTMEKTAGYETAGFKTIQLNSKQPKQTFRSRSGRVITGHTAAHMWEVKASYNELTKDQFTTIYAFLMARQADRRPFYIRLPQQSQSLRTNYLTESGVNAGQNKISHSALAETAIPGDFFNIQDTENPRHLKTYMYVGQDAQTSQFLVSPSFQYYVNASTATINFSDVKVRVYLKGSDISYSVDQNNLYKLSLSLDEALI